MVVMILRDYAPPHNQMSHGHSHMLRVPGQGVCMSSVTTPDGNMYPLFVDAYGKVVTDGGDNGWCAILMYMSRGATLSLFADECSLFNFCTPPLEDGSPDSVEILRVIKLVFPVLAQGCFNACMTFMPTHGEMCQSLTDIVSEL